MISIFKYYVNAGFLKKKGLIGLEGGFCLFMNKYFICNQKYNFEISNSYLIFKRKYPYEGRQGVLLMMSPSVWPIKYLNRPWNRVSITSLQIYYLGILRGGEKILIINHQQDLLNMRTHTLVICACKTILKILSSLQP